MRKIFTFITFLCIAMAVSASINGYKSIMLNHHDGSSDIVTIGNEMTVSAANGELTLKCDKGTVSVKLEDLQNWTYSKLAGSDDLWAGIDAPEADLVEVRFGAESIELFNLPEKSTVMLTAIDGKTLVSTTVDADYFNISLSGLNGGVYILTYNNKSLKIAVK